MKNVFYCLIILFFLSPQPCFSEWVQFDEFSCGFDLPNPKAWTVQEDSLSGAYQLVLIYESGEYVFSLGVMRPTDKQLSVTDPDFQAGYKDSKEEQGQHVLSEGYIEQDGKKGYSLKTSGRGQGITFQGREDIFAHNGYIQAFGIFYYGDEDNGLEWIEPLLDSIEFYD